MAQKTGKVIVPTEPASRAMTITGFTFKSYDKKAGVLQFEIKNQDGSPTDLIDATVRLFMYIYQGEEKKEFPIFDNQIITESYMQGIVKYRIPDMLLSYEGKVDANVYIDFPDGSHTDNLAFTFNIEKSVIDDNVQLNGEYYFKDFQQLLDGVKQEATDAVNEALAKVEVVSENVSSAQNDLTILEDRIDQTNQQISNLGKLKKMYSNSIDFGGYDYSGNPNIAPNVGFNDFYNNGSQTGYTAKDEVDHIAVTRTADAPSAGKLLNLRTLLPNKTYTLSVDIWADKELPSGAISCGIQLKEGTNVRTAWALISKPVSTNRTTYSVTFTTAANFVTTEESRITFWFGNSAGACTGYLGYNIKIEEGSTATPYQPNLLDDPYYLSKVPLGENLFSTKDWQNRPPFSVSSINAMKILAEPRTEYIMSTNIPNWADNTTCDLFVFNSDGTPNSVDNGVALNKPRKVTTLDDGVVIVAMRNHEFSSGSFWAKLEKGDTRTPNISQFKYFGEGLKDSNNPNDYSWDVTPEYTEKGLNNTVSLTEPQSVEGLKNFEDGLQIAGKEVATVPEDTGWVNLTAINGHSWNKQGQIRRIGKLVMFRGSLKGSTLSTQDFCTIPEGFRPSNPTDNYEYQFLLPPQSSNTLDNGGMAYIRPNGVCGLPSFRGTVNLFLAPIQYYID